MADAAIQLQGIEKHFDDIKALDGVSFAVPLHSIFGLLGPNGAGKTTLFSIVADFLRADRGEIEVLGQPLTHNSQLRGRMTILPQDAQFQRNVPLREQLVLFRRLDGCDLDQAERQVERALERVGLQEYAKRGARVLSHGMVKRLGIAQAFLGDPELILLDEPTAGLDPGNARQIRDLIKELHGKATIVISSHNLDEIQELCTDAAILHRGKMIRAGSVADLTRGQSELDLELSRELEPGELELLAGLPGVAECTSTNPRQYTIRLELGGASSSNWDETVGGILRALLDQQLVPRRMREGRSLEHLFLQLTEAAEAQATAPPP